MAQLKSRNKKDWVTTVLKDLEELEIKLSFEEIRKMKKSSFQALVKTKINEYAFKNLEKEKLSHSKVVKINHKMLQLRTYFVPNNMKASKEEIQTIFKLRCRMTNLKTNMKGMYENIECPLCEGKGAEDSQEHVIQECKMIENMIQDKSEMINYDNLYENDALKLIEIGRKFISRMKIREKVLNRLETNVGPRDEILSMSADISVFVMSELKIN